MNSSVKVSDHTSPLDENQLNTVADLAASDILLRSVWENCVQKYVRRNVWNSLLLERSVMHRVSEIIEELSGDTVSEMMEDA